MEPAEDSTLMLEVLLEVRTNVRTILWILADEDEQEGTQEEDL